MGEMNDATPDLRRPGRSGMQSALYFGTVRHRRYAPTPHAFTHRLYMAWLDLSELDSVFRDRWFWSTRRRAISWLRRADYLGDPRISLDEAVREHIAAQTGRRPEGPIRLLTHLRTFGYCFNPVSFYYCYDTNGLLETIAAQITNTPWNERHTYILPVQAPHAKHPARRFRFAKNFHVSPFMPMQVDYDWRFTLPSSHLAVHMVNRRANETIFDATLHLRRREIDSKSLATALLAYPFMSAQVTGAIYWHALRLWLKRTPLHGHPRHTSQEEHP
jgi:uncharacterized protein